MDGVGGRIPGRNSKCRFREAAVDDRCGIAGIYGGELVDFFVPEAQTKRTDFDGSLKLGAIASNFTIGFPWSRMMNLTWMITWVPWLRKPQIDAIWHKPCRGFPGHKLVGHTRVTWAIQVTSVHVAGAAQNGVRRSCSYSQNCVCIIYIIHIIIYVHDNIYIYMCVCILYMYVYLRISADITYKYKYVCVFVY